MAADRPRQQRAAALDIVSRRVPAVTRPIAQAEGIGDATDIAVRVSVAFHDLVLPLLDAGQASLPARPPRRTPRIRTPRTEDSRPRESGRRAPKTTVSRLAARGLLRLANQQPDDGRHQKIGTHNALSESARKRPPGYSSGVPEPHDLEGRAARRRARELDAGLNSESDAEPSAGSHGQRQAYLRGYRAGLQRTASLWIPTLSRLAPAVR
jgi:hypothetical protein